MREVERERKEIKERRRGGEGAGGEKEGKKIWR